MRTVLTDPKQLIEMADKLIEMRIPDGETSVHVAANEQMKIAYNALLSASAHLLDAARAG